MTKAIPEGLTSLTPQMNLDNANEAIVFFKKAFGAEEKNRAPDPSGKKIWHAELHIGNAAFFVNDSFPEMGTSPNVTNLWLYTENVDAAFQRAVDAGAQVKMQVQDMFWGDRIGAVADRWGNTWTLSQRTRDLSSDQMKKETEKVAAEWNARTKKN